MNIYKNNWNFKTVSIFVFLLVLPNALGLLNISLSHFKIHTFQIAIFLAAMIFGPVGGLLSGVTGSVYSAILMHNPYIIIGNAILGFFTGYFYRKKMHITKAVLLAFAIQLPWLIASDFLFGLPLKIIAMIVISLAISNTVWSFAVHYGFPKAIKE